MIEKLKINNFNIIKHKTNFNTISFVVYIKVGPILETKENNGISHFIEHMLFKGSKKYSTRKMAEVLDGIGGDINAFTTREYTVVHGKVLNEYLEILIDVLSDMIINTLFLEEEFEKEKNVIYEEINASEDIPEEILEDLSATVFEGGLSYPILGTKENIENFTVEDLKNFKNAYYTKDNMVISISGNIDDSVDNLIKKYFVMDDRKVHIEKRECPFIPKNNYIYKELEQTYFEIVYKGLSLQDEKKYSMFIVNNLLGASVSSRLFQHIREEKGLTYSINSDVSMYEDSGMLVISGSLQPENLTIVNQLIYKEIKNLIDNGITEEELLRNKKQMRAVVLMDSEQNGFYSYYNAKNHIMNLQDQSAEDIVNAYDLISIEEVNQLIKEVFSSKPSIFLLGSLDDKLYHEVLDIWHSNL